MIRTKELTRLALLVSVALALFVIELQIPNPFFIPGVKLGLANIITVYALYHYRAGEVRECQTKCVTLLTGGLKTLIYTL